MENWYISVLICLYLPSLLHGGCGNYPDRVKRLYNGSLHQSVCHSGMISTEGLKQGSHYDLEVLWCVFWVHKVRGQRRITGKWWLGFAVLSECQSILDTCHQE